MLRSPEFTSADAVFGTNGDKLLEYTNVYKYEDHHAYNISTYSNSGFIVYNTVDWLLMLQYGRVADSLSILEMRFRALETMLADIPSNSSAQDLACGPSNMMLMYHLHGQSDGVRRVIKACGFTFDSISDYLSDATRQDPLFTIMEHEGTGGGFFSLKRILWQYKSFMVMHTDVPVSNATAWLESLPNDEAFYQYSMTLPTHDFGGLYGSAHHTFWLALAHEKVGLYDGALRFCRLALEPDPLKAGVPSLKWAQTIALACKGRVLTKLSRHAEALEAFQAAIQTSKLSYPMIEAFALRELTNYVGIGDVGEAAVSVQAGKDLEAKLGSFEGRLTRGEFDTLTIAP